MRAVGRAKCVAYIHIAEIGQFFGEVLSVLGLFFAAETGILEQNHVSLIHSCYSRSSRLARHMVVGHKIYRLSKLFRQSLCNGGQGLALIGAVLYLSQVGTENHFSAVFHQFLDGGKCGFDTCLVCNLPVF